MKSYDEMSEEELQSIVLNDCKLGSLPITANSDQDS